jgi:hypothetical protein
MRHLLYTFLLCSLFVNIPLPVNAHLTRDQAACFKKGQPRQVVKESTQPNGLVLEGYDTNKDGKADITTLSHNEGAWGSHRAFPLFYLLDLDFDGEPDAVYIDREGFGFCTDIMLYEDLNMPHDTGLNFSEQTQTEKGRAI